MQKGYLPVKQFTTLRNFLADELHCQTMRLSKKFHGKTSLGLVRSSIVLGAKRRNDVLRPPRPAANVRDHEPRAPRRPRGGRVHGGIKTNPRATSVGVFEVPAPVGAAAGVVFTHLAQPTGGPPGCRPCRPHALWYTTEHRASQPGAAHAHRRWWFAQFGSPTCNHRDRPCTPNQEASAVGVDQEHSRAHRDETAHRATYVALPTKPSSFRIITTSR